MWWNIFQATFFFNLRHKKICPISLEIVTVVEYMLFLNKPLLFSWSTIPVWSLKSNSFKVSLILLGPQFNRLLDQKKSWWSKAFQTLQGNGIRLTAHEPCLRVYPFLPMPIQLPRECVGWSSPPPPPVWWIIHCFNRGGQASRRWLIMKYL